MAQKVLREWKKVFRSDLSYIVYELKELVKTPAMIILDGTLGAGKTTFIQNFCGDETTLSPTYSVLSETKNILHADFYRLEKNEEILQLELPIYLEDKQYFFVEWGLKFHSRLMRELPENWSAYVLEIVVNQNTEGPEGASRNFTLSSFSED